MSHMNIHVFQEETRKGRVESALRKAEISKQTHLKMDPPLWVVIIPTGHACVINNF